VEKCRDDYQGDHEEPMNTLEEHNADREKMFEQVTKFLREVHMSHDQNGIECPGCGAEMTDSNEMRESVDGQYQKEIHCPACGYQTTCLA